ncbi:MAG: glycerol-3-phosphate 1-O-acyltransferase PlsY [Aquabacterium sp.]|nr:MAG: glycerol-3-phosphate 1-O-acyltransferase PlsY [Aquabacterium sp.]
MSDLDLPLLAAAVVASYLLGSLSFAVVVSRMFGLADPRTYGSGNPGATNVLRSGNKAAAALTLLLDAFKGWLPAFLAAHWWPQPQHVQLAAMAVGVAAFLGHLWPVFFRFEGGKGVATAAGVLLGMDPMLGLLSLGCWLAVALVFRYSSLAAMVTAAAAPVIVLVRGGGPLTAAGLALMAALLIWRHDANIRKLLAGTESKIGQRAKPAGGPSGN